MNRQEAKEILLLYRPETADRLDPAIAEALSLAQQDKELATWFEQHQAFQHAMRTRLRQLEAPAHFKAALLAEAKIIRPAIWWQHPVWLAAAAAVLLLVGYLGWWQRGNVPDHFADYRKMMVAKAEGQYGMQWETANMTELRKHFAEHGAPADYRLPQRLQKAQLLGGLKLSWRARPVSMICLRTVDNKNVWLFVADQSSVKDAPREQRKVDKVDRLLTASWTEGGRLYVLAAPEEGGFEGKYF